MKKVFLAGKFIAGELVSLHLSNDAMKHDGCLVYFYALSKSANPRVIEYAEMLKQKELMKV